MRRRQMPDGLCVDPHGRWTIRDRRCAFERKDDILRFQNGPIVEADTFAQDELPRCRIEQGPRLCQRRDYPQSRIAGGKRLEYPEIRLRNWPAGLKRGVT